MTWKESVLEFYLDEKGKIKKHIKYTSSYRSKEILEDFDKFESRFWLISPKAISVKDLLKATTASAA